MPMSTAAYEAATFADEGGAAVACGLCLPAHAENEKGNNHASSIQSSKQSKTTTSKKERRFSLLRRLSSSKLTKSGTNQQKSQHKSSFGLRRLRPESSAPARWPARRRSSLQSDMSGLTWLTSCTGNSSSRGLDGGGGDAGMHNEDQNTGTAEAAEEVAGEPFQNPLPGDDLSEVLLRGLGVRRDDSRRQLLLNSTPGSQHADDGSHDSSSDDMGMYRTAHGGNDEDGDNDIDIHGSFLSCIAEPFVPLPQDPAQTRHSDAFPSDSEQQVEQRPPSPPPVHHPRRRKSVEFQDVVSYATVADKRALTNDELNVLFYSVEEEALLRHELKSEIRAVKASPCPSRTHPTFCPRGVEQYFLSRKDRQNRLDDQQNIIDVVLDEQYDQMARRGQVYDEGAIAIASIRASQDARLDALERGGSDETEAILIRGEDCGKNGATKSKMADAVRINRSTLNESILGVQFRRASSNEGALCA